MAKKAVPVQDDEPTAEVLSSDDDEAPEEVGQADARQVHDERDVAIQEAADKLEAKRLAKEKRRKKAQKRRLAAEQDEDALPESLLLEAAKLKTDKEHREKQQEAEARKRQRLAKAGPVVIGGTDPSKSELPVLPARGDNIQLAVPTTLNGKEVIVYQEANRSTMFDDADDSEDDEEEGAENMDSSVQDFTEQFFFGNRRRRVELSALRKPSDVRRMAERRRAAAARASKKHKNGPASRAKARAQKLVAST